jgi:LuxR family transcriptional regulator, maltose regulon positive regulatory protein
MATTSKSATRHGALQRRRIIERPRLLALLDRSTARVRTLVAPAGYGKTTLAEQWIARDGRASAWFKIRNSSADVAGLGLGLARASTALVPGCDERLREHLRASPAPAENVDVLAEILGEDLQHWPADAWLVIDEYEEIVGAEDAERFVDALIAASPIQLVVTSRLRPGWSTEKAILYDEVAEIGQDDLAMDDREAAEVLAGRSAPSTSGLLAVANGWPAVIGLASVTPADVGQLDDVPETLYRYVAQEVFGALDEDVQAGLESLAIAPVLDRVLAEDLLGAELSQRVHTSALDVGVMVERSGQLELHPLARTFLRDRGRHSAEARAAIAARCLAHYRERREWEAAFDLIARDGAPELLEDVLVDALDELLTTGRVSTLETWHTFAVEAGLDSAWFALARAEVALRRGRFTEAQTSAEAAASTGPALTYRALSIAGRAAHLASREEVALEFYERAESAAKTEDENREAVWGQLACLIDLERPQAAVLLKQLSPTVVRSDPTDVVKCAGRRLSYQFRLGDLDLDEADRAYELIGGLRDPIDRAAFECSYASGLVLAARYDEALAVAESAIDCARRFRLDFALPYALCFAATANAGNRRWVIARTQVNEALREACSSNNAFARHLCLAALIRTLAQEGRHEAALAIDVPKLHGSLPSCQAEARASRALVLASASRLSEARDLIDEIRDSTSAIEPAILMSAVDAIVALKSRDPAAPRCIDDFVDHAFKRGALDLIVTAYRSAPELLGVLLAGAPPRERVGRLVSRVGDEDLAAAVGQPLALDDRRDLLSPREHEVLRYLENGLTNSQIAAALFIAESTVKVHVHHIFDKLGVRSRADLAMRARLRGFDQATSATTGEDGMGGPSLL